ncbi:ENTH-domain-containing protein [Trametes gibbosa]|nr:ENTH-domain-containing protein [Trametes gibbosa]
MAFHNLGKSAVRVAKSYTLGYSHTQTKIRNATCNDPWPPSGKEMFELSQMTYNQNDFVDIMEVIDKRLNDKGKNWRHVFKSLVVLDYLLHSGSENVIRYCEDNLYEIKTLREFQFVDDDGKDEGANVRQKAKDITNLLMDKNRLHEERRIRSQMRDRMLGRRANSDGDEDEEQAPRTQRPANGASGPRDTEEDQLRRAIEESKRTAEQERATAEDNDLQRAIRLSQEEEEKRKKALDEANATALFDASNQQPPQTRPLIDATLPLQFTSNGIQPQFTALQPQFTSIQPQFTSFNPYLQQAQQDAMQAEYLRQQAEWAQQQQLLAQQQTVTPQPFLVPYQTGLPPISQPLVPQPTSFGSNNPFLAPPSPPTSPTTSLSTLLPQRAVSASAAEPGPVSFNLAGTYDGRPGPQLDPSYGSRSNDRERIIASASAPPRALLQPFSTGTEPPQKLGGEREHARLANLFANYTGDGVDTFGNTGRLRFVATQYGRVAEQKTGAGEPSRNPFVHPDQALRQQHAAEEKLIDI